MVALRLLLLAGVCLLVQAKPAQDSWEQLWNYAEKFPNPYAGTDFVDLEYGELVQGDIELLPGEDYPPKQVGPLNAVWNKDLLWTDNILYYTMNNVFTDEEIEAIHAGIDDLVESTSVDGEVCVDIRERNSESNWVWVTQTGGCSSSVGMRGGRQSLSLESSCITRHGTIMHEFLHAFGFHHEQCREDRDDYVTIVWENIEEGKEHNFIKYEEGVDIDHLGTYYDYGSVLHYGAYSFSVNESIPTIIPHDPDAEIGQRTHMSQCDIERVQILYGCIEPESAECLEEDEIEYVKEWLRN